MYLLTYLLSVSFCFWVTTPCGTDQSTDRRSQCLMRCPEVGLLNKTHTTATWTQRSPIWSHISPPRHLMPPSIPLTYRLAPSNSRRYRHSYRCFIRGRRPITIYSAICTALLPAIKPVFMFTVTHSSNTALLPSISVHIPHHKCFPVK